MVNVSPIPRQFSEHVVVILIDLPRLSNDALVKDEFTCKYLMEKLERKLSTKQSLSRLIEKQIEKLQQFNMYMARDRKMVFSNIHSKYLQIIGSEMLKRRNSQLVKQVEESERKCLNVMGIPFFQKLDKWFQTFDWSKAIHLLETLSHYFSPFALDLSNNYLFAKLLLSSTVNSYFLQFLQISKRHMRNDKVNYYRFSLYFIHEEHESVLEECFNSKLEKEHLARRNEFPLKVIILIGKHTLEWTENGFIQVEELNYSSELETCCFRSSFLVCRKSEQIEYYMKKLIDFNCKWNASMCYNDEQCNTGHYAKSLLSYLNISLSNRDSNTLLDCICDNRPVPFEFNIPVDLVMVSPIKKALSNYLNSIGYEPKWVRPISNCISQETSHETFFLKLDRTWDEIETFYHFFLRYLSVDCPFLDVSEEFSLFLLALLESNREIVRGESFASLVNFSKKQILELLRRRRNQSYHSQLYNFSDFNSMKKSIIEKDVHVLKDISAFLEE
ncbi:predicted protein [Naegleria gruberi]|uniref:Predicted protein n=1 Tax=Naegleria gruberi TaxID=5762 RepID=D2VWI8_NAEGR|nr:uncharacterized protein NAEGRDRAFT_73395 [Naegleria gruberi]EFC38847.1 predicted protein [Naegleria gruberi]|eukprot:XP_002671591.1 predicted protein [Naegleria gruberi strain NEG-M]